MDGDQDASAQVSDLTSVPAHARTRPSGVPASVDVVVVGAGVAGLRAAALLTRSGREVCLLEAADRVGGRVTSDDVDAHVVDRGFQVINPGYPALARAVDLDRLGLRPFTAGLAVRDDRGLHRWGHPLHAPRLAPGALLAGLRNPREGLALVRWLRPVLTAGPGAHRLVDRLGSTADVSLGDGLDAAGVRGELRTAIEAFLAGVLLDHPRDVAQRYVLLVLRSFLAGVPGVPADGVRRLPELMAEPLDDVLHLQTPALGLERRDAGFVVTTPAGEVRARAVLCATDGPAAHDLLGLPRPAARGVVTQWWSTTEAPATTSLVHVDARGHGPLVNTAVVSQAAPRYAPAGRHLVQGSALLSGGSTAAPTEIAMRTHAGEILGVDTSGWEPIARHEIPDALPGLPAPAGSRLAGVVVLDGEDDLLVAGDHRATPSLQGALASGERAARTLIGRQHRTSASVGVR